MTKNTRCPAVIGFALLFGFALGSRAQVLETETARLLPEGAYKFGTAFEFQRSSEGIERAVPFLLEYGFTDYLEIAVEPVVYTAIRPKAGQSATGVGDIEATLSYRFLPEMNGRPALAAAVEVKVPTAKNSLIGTGRSDYAGYLIASKKLGAFDLHAHVGYGVLGSPRGQQLSNVFQGAIAAVYRPDERYEIFSEVLGTTASTSTEGDTPPSTQKPGVTTPEAPSGELFGTIGGGYFLTPRTLVFVSGTYDNRSAFLARVGFTVAF